MTRTPPSFGFQPDIEVVDVRSDHPGIPTGTFYSLREADTKLAAAYTPRLAREAPVVSYVVSWVDAQLVMRSFPADRAAWTASRRAGGLVRFDVLRTVRAWAEHPTDVTLQRRGAMFLRRMEADAARFAPRNAQSPGAGPTLLPDPHAVFAQRRDRYTGRRPMAVASADLADGSRGGVPIVGYPETTNADVRYLVNWISLALTGDLRQLHPDDSAGIWNAWRVTVTTIESILRLHGSRHDAAYLDNEGLWLRQLPGIVGMLADAIVAREPHRNGRLRFRGVGGVGEPYPAWVQDLRDRAGVYVIREHQSDGNKPIVYVGSSKTNLYATLSRHFQSWRRGKTFWTGYHAPSGAHDPGLTYERATVDAAVIFTDPDDARAVEYATIERLAPRDNLIGQAAPADDDWYSTQESTRPASAADIPF